MNDTKNSYSGYRCYPVESISHTYKFVNLRRCSLAKQPTVFREMACRHPVKRPAVILRNTQAYHPVCMTQSQTS